MTKKNIWHTFIFVLLVTILFNSFDKVAMASVGLDVKSVGQNIVTLKVSGELSQGNYAFYIYDEDSYSAGTENYIYKRDYPVLNTLINGLEISFSGLEPSHRYVGLLDKEYSQDNMTTGWGPDDRVIVHFATLDDPNAGTELLTLKNVTNTSVYVEVTGLFSANTYEVYLYKSGGTTPAQKKSVSVVDGKGNVSFNGLLTNASYIVGIVKNNEPLSVISRVPFVARETALAGSTSSGTSTTSSTIKYSGIVPVCNTGPIDTKTGQYSNPCNFNYFMALLNSIIRFLLFVIATPLVALIIMYTGYLYLTAGGSAGQTEKAKHILFNVVVGYIIALAAWLIVNTIVSSLLPKETDINTFLDKSALVK